MAKVTVADVRRMLLEKEKLKLEAKMAGAQIKPKNIGPDWTCGICKIKLQIKHLAHDRRKVYCVKCGLSE